MVTTTLMNDLLGSMINSLYITILRKVDCENKWEIYIQNQSCSKRGCSLLRSIMQCPIHENIMLI